MTSDKASYVWIRTRNLVDLPCDDRFVARVDGICAAPDAFLARPERFEADLA